VRSRRPLLAAATAIFAVLMLAAPVMAALDSVSGNAYGEYVNVTLLRINTTSGPLPTTGNLLSDGSNSPLNNSALSACAPSPGCTTLSTGALTVHTDGTIGAAGSVHSTASVLAVSALAGLVTGDVVASQCAVDSGGATSGSSTLTNVQVNGIVVASNPGPNTVLVLLDAGALVIGSVTLNEQTYNAITNTLTVNAIHIHLASGSLGTGDIIISHVECDALPAGPAPVIPESPLAILLPLSALVVGGGILLVVLRRQQTLQAR
jgi:hypothetical protein